MVDSRVYKFHDDINIGKIYSDVISDLNSMLDRRTEIKNDYDRYKIIAEKSHNITDKSAASSIVLRYDTFISYLMDGSIVQEYNKKVSNLLNEYDILSPSTRIFGMDNCNNIPKRVAIIRKFLQISEKYVNIEWECTYNMSRICSVCFKHMKKMGSIMQCRECGHTQLATISIDGGSQGISTGESTYKPRKNYDKEFRHVCGLSHGSSHNQVVDIESYLYRSGIHNPTRTDIRSAIRACGHCNYNDTNWIYSQISGEELPQLEAYGDITGNRFEMYYRAFSNANKEGKNITNIHFLIRLFLWQENIDYNEEWFSVLSDRTLTKHRNNAIIVCNILKEEFPDMNWNYPSEWGS